MTPAFSRYAHVLQRKIPRTYGNMRFFVNLSAFESEMVECEKSIEHFQLRKHQLLMYDELRKKFSSSNEFNLETWKKHIEIKTARHQHLQSDELMIEKLDKIVSIDSTRLKLDWFTDRATVGLLINNYSCTLSLLGSEDNQGFQLMTSNDCTERLNREQLVGTLIKVRACPLFGNMDNRQFLWNVCFALTFPSDHAFDVLSSVLMDSNIIESIDESKN